MPRFARVTQDCISPSQSFELPDPLDALFLQRVSIHQTTPIASLLFTEADGVFHMCEKLITWICSRCLCCVHHLTELMCFLFNPSQCHFPSLMPQLQYCTGRYVLCPCLDQGHSLKTAKAKEGLSVPSVLSQL